MHNDGVDEIVNQELLVAPAHSRQQRAVPEEQPHQARLSPFRQPGRIWSTRAQLSVWTRIPSAIPGQLPGKWGNPPVQASPIPSQQRQDQPTRLAKWLAPPY